MKEKPYSLKGAQQRLFLLQPVDENLPGLASKDLENPFLFLQLKNIFGAELTAMKLLRYAITCCLLLLSFVLRADNTKPKIEKTPAWVLPVQVNYNDKSLDEEAEDGYSDLLYEQQVSLLQLLFRSA